MRKLFVSLAVLGLAFSMNAATAQESAPQSAPAPAPSADVSDEQLATFADIYVDMRKIRSRLAAKVPKDAGQEKVKEMRMQMRDEVIATIEARDWTVQKYNDIARTVGTDEQLKEKVVALVNERLK